MKIINVACRSSGLDFYDSSPHLQRMFLQFLYSVTFSSRLGLGPRSMLPMPECRVSRHAFCTWFPNFQMPRCSLRIIDQSPIVLRNPNVHIPRGPWRVQQMQYPICGPIVWSGVTPRRALGLTWTTYVYFILMTEIRYWLGETFSFSFAELRK